MLWRREACLIILSTRGQSTVGSSLEDNFSQTCPRSRTLSWILPSLSKMHGCWERQNRKTLFGGSCGNILFFPFSLARHDRWSGWAYWPVSKHMLSWDSNITRAESVPARKDLQKELELILEDQVLFCKRTGVQFAPPKRWRLLVLLQSAQLAH